jgi:hypothetical protein
MCFGVIDKSIFVLAQMYAALVCFVLFDARGNETATLAPAAVLMALCSLAIEYIPRAIHRPQATVQALCDDILAMAVFVACIVIVQGELLQYACTLHSVCHFLNWRFRGVGTHAALCLLLMFAYFNGPRITESKDFIVAMLFPVVSEFLAKALQGLHRVLVLWLQQEMCV